MQRMRTNPIQIQSHQWLVASTEQKSTLQLDSKFEQ